MFLFRRSLPFSRRRSSSQDDTNVEVCENTTTSASSSHRTRSATSRRHSDSELSTPKVPIQGGQAFRVKVPVGAKPGDNITVRAPDGQYIEIECPASCKSGQHITIRPDRKTSCKELAHATLKDLLETAKANFEATQASCKSLRARLRDELELQKGLWFSSASCSQSLGYRCANTTSLAPAAPSVDDLSQSQVLVFAAADAGDGKQLAAALAEAKKFSTVSLSLEECCRELNSSEEAMVTWQCLLDALQAENRHEIEVWIEEARELGLEIPAGLDDALHELSRREEESLNHLKKCRDIEEKLKFALEAGDPELLEDMLAEARSIGSRSSLVQQATAQLRAKRQVVLGVEIPNKTLQKPTAASTPTPVGGQWLPRPRSPPRNRSENTENRQAQPEPRMQPESSGFDSVGRSSSSSSTFNQVNGPEVGAGPNSTAHTYAQRQHAPPDDGPSVKDLLEECKRLGIDTRGCTDRSDLQHLIRTAPRSTSTPKVPAQQGFKTQTPKLEFAQSSSAASVWNRKFAPPRYVTKRSQALYLLGLDATKPLSQPELRTAYRKCAMECHPDRAQNHSRQEQAKELFQEVKEAFDLLSSQ